MQKDSNQNIIFTVIILALIGVGGFFFLQNDSANQSLSDNSQLAASNTAISETNQNNSDEEQLQRNLWPDTNEVERTYIKVTNACDHNFSGEDCLNVRSGPGTEYSVVDRLRNDMVLEVEEVVENEGRNWYKIIFDQHLYYPERVSGDWYVAADFVNTFVATEPTTSWEDGEIESNKRIVIDRSDQKLYAYNGDTLFMETDVSTGEELTPTPNGTFDVFKKMPSRYMQGPLPGVPTSDYYDLSGVPWNLYFTEGGAVIHGAYWHDNFGNRHSHGCVNLPPDKAEKLYNWATLGTQVTVRN